MDVGKVLLGDQQLDVGLSPGHCLDAALDHQGQVDARHYKPDAKVSLGLGGPAALGAEQEDVLFALYPERYEGMPGVQFEVGHELELSDGVPGVLLEEG